MKAVRYDRFPGIDGIHLAGVPEPAAGPGEVVVRVEVGVLNPGALPAAVRQFVHADPRPRR